MVKDLLFFIVMVVIINLGGIGYISAQELSQTSTSIPNPPFKAETRNPLNSDAEDSSAKKTIEATALSTTDAEVASTLVLAQEEPRISVSLRNIDIIDALKFFSFKSGFNIVPTQAVTGRVTLTVENAPLKDVFDIMLRSNSLAYDKKGEIYNVMTEKEYKERYGKNFFDTRKVKVFRLKYAVPEQAFGLLDAIKSDIGRLLVDAESGSVMLIDTPEKLNEAKDALEALEQKSIIKVFNLKYAKAKDIEEQLKAQLDLKKVGTVKADERTNQVIIQTLPERMKNIEELVASLDKKTKAVLIDTKIIKIKLTDQRDKGIQWEGLFNIAKQYGMVYIGSYPFSAITAGLTSAVFRTREQHLSGTPPITATGGGVGGQVGSYPFSGTTADLYSGTKVSPGKRMHIGIVDGKRDFDVLIKYLQTLGKSKIMASPSLAVINNQEAKIHIGERRAYVTTTTTAGATTTTVSEDVTYIDVGVRLSVTPTINEDGYITIKVKPEISSIVGNVKTASNNLIPIVDTSVAETTVMAKDGSTIIIGGLGREEKAEDSEAMPFFSRIPLIGALFKSSTQRTEHVELVIMLTPIIFEGDRFITPADAHRLKAKQLKHFDVFRPEGISPLTAPQLPLSQREEFELKNFKSYQTGFIQERFKDKERNLAAKDGVSGEFAAKGFRGYEVEGVEETLPLKSPLVDLPKYEQELGPKGLREHN